MKANAISGGLILFSLVLLLNSCQSIYYDALERAGFPRRDLLVRRAHKAQEAQEEAKEQFRSALERFGSVIEIQGGELEEKYEAFREEFEAGKNQAEAVRERIDAVKSVAASLFDEWEEELDQYTDPSLRRASAARLKETRAIYGRFIRAMEQAAAKMDPVLATFQDQVLYLKHNLNARAIAAVEGEMMQVKLDVAELIRAMERSIAEARSFIRAMEKT